MNYAITKLILAYLIVNGRSYRTYNDVLGVLDAVKQELYRKEIVEYEEKKEKLNGPIYKWEGESQGDYL